MGAWRPSPRIKRRPDRPYVLGLWCNQTRGAWSYPHEAADQILGAYTATVGDWDAMVRRGIFLFPLTWGEGPAGTVGGEDIFQIAEVVNGSPHIYGALAARGVAFPSWLSDQPETTADHADRTDGHEQPKYARLRAGTTHVADLLIDTPYTQGVAGWIGGETASFATLDFATEQPVRRPDRHLDQRRADRHHQAVAGLRHRARRAHRVPLGRFLEARGRRPRPAPLPPGTRHRQVVWRHKGTVRAFVLDNDGKRTARRSSSSHSPAATAVSPDDRRQDRGVPLGIDRRMIDSPRSARDSLTRNVRGSR